MADKDPMTVKPPSDPIANAILTLAESLSMSQQQLHATLEALKQSQPPRDVSFGDTDYQERLRESTKVLKRPAYQNGYEVNPSGLSDEVIDRLAALKPGAYLKNVVTVAVDGNNAVHLIYKNRTPDQRMQLPFTSFSDLVNKVWAEMRQPVTA
jgi:hypothetical protein